MIAAVLTLLATVMPLAAPDAGPWVVDRLVVAVPEVSAEKGGEALSRRPITQSELEFEARVAMIRQGGVLAATRPISDELLANTVDYVVGQDLALLEIQRSKIDEPDEADVLKERDAFANQFPTPSTYQAFLKLYDPSDARVGEEALLAILRRDLRVSRYFERRSRLLVRIDEAEIKRYIADHPEVASALDKQSLNDAVRKKLTHDRAVEITRREMAAIRERHRFEVQMIAPLARHPRPSDPSSSAAGGAP